MKIKLLLLCFFVSCLTCHAQQVEESNCKKQQEEDSFVQYDDLSKKNVHIFVEQMPNYKGGNAALLSDFDKYFHYSFQANEKMQTKLNFQFVIDTEGHLIGARIRDKEPDTLTNFEKAGLEALTLLQNWEPGKHDGKKVNVILAMPINVDYQYR